MCKFSYYRWVVVAAVLGGMAAWPPLQTVAARDQLPPGSAIGWIPADAALCGAVLRGREQFDALAASRAGSRLADMPVWEQFAKAWQLPVVRLARELLYERFTEPGTTGAQLETLINDPQLRRAAALVADMLSEEIVWHADTHAVDFLRRLSRAPESAGLGVLLQQDRLGADPRQARRAAVKRLVDALAESAARSELPAVVWTFRVSDTQRAAEQLGKLELVASLICWTRPELRGRLRRASVCGGSYITLTLDGRLVAPWARRELAALEFEPDEIAEIVAELERLPLVVALGMRQNYVVLSVGPSLDALQKMHGDAARLVDRPELAPLKDALRQRLTGVSYLSPSLTAALYETFLDPADALLHRSPGAVLAYSLWTDRGVELLTFDWTAHPGWAEVEPLSLLAHAGERPLALVAWCIHLSEERYSAWANCLAAAGKGLDTWLRPRLGTQSLKSYRIALALGKPLTRHGEAALREMLLPLAEQGQSMIVLDARRSECGRLAVRPALVVDLSRAGTLQAAYAELGRMCVEIGDALAGVDSEQPEEPTAGAEQPNGPSTAWHRGFPRQSPLQPHVYYRGDGQPEALAPALGLSPYVAVVALTAGRAGELLEPHAPRVGGLLAEPRDRISAAYLDWPQVVELARPALHGGARSLADAFTREENPVDDAAKWEFLHSQVDTLLDLLQVVRSFSSQQYVAGGALVTHHLIEISDVD